MIRTAVLALLSLPLMPAALTDVVDVVPGSAMLDASRGGSKVKPLAGLSGFLLFAAIIAFFLRPGYDSIDAAPKFPSPVCPISVVPV